MRREVSRKLEMGARVRDFCIAHPSDAGNVKDAVARLDELLRKAESLGMAQRSGRLEELSAANRRNALRRSAKFELLHHLVTIGRLAGEEVPSLAGKFYLRSPDATHTSFLASTKLMLRLAEENKELLMRKGLSEDLLTELSAAVAQFEEAMTSGRNGRSEHIRARTELEEVADAVVRTVGIITGLYRFKLKNSPDLTRTLERLRIIGPKSAPEPVEPPKGDGGGETPPSSGGVAAA